MTVEELSRIWRAWAERSGSSDEAYSCEDAVQLFASERGLSPSRFREQVVEQLRAGADLNNAIEACS